MKKRRFQFGGNVNETVPASRQNIDQRTPTGVRPVSSPVVPVKSDVQGAMKHGGELKMGKSVKRMSGGGKGAPAPGQLAGRGRGRGQDQGKGPAPGGMSGPMPVDRSSGVSRGGGGGGFSGTGRPPESYVGTAGNLPGGFMGGQDQGKGPPPGGMRYPMGGPDQGKGPPPGAGGMPMGGGMGGIGPGVLGPQGLPNPNMNPLMQRQGMGQNGPELGIGEGKGPVPGRGRGLPNAMMGMNQMGVGPRAPGMKKGGKVSASSYNDMTGGAAGGIGRLEKSSIAAKTKSQKLKKGGKVKGYYSGGDISKEVSGGDYLTEGDRLAMKKAGISEGGDRGMEMAAYRARQDAAEKRTRKAKSSEPTYASQRAAQPGPDVDVYGDLRRDRGKGGGARGGPSSGGEAQMRSMGLYPFGSDSNNVGGTTGLKTPNTYGDSERGNGPGPNPKKKRSALDKALFGTGLDAMGNDIKAYGRTHDYAGRPIPTGARSGKIDQPDGSGGMTGDLKKGGKVKMAKGGKTEAFENTAKDMAQDKKLAKKRGMSFAAWEKSSADTKHDKQQNMKGLKKGGHVKGCQCMACGGGVKRMASGGMSTAQDGMKGALRPKPTAMAKGGVVKKTFGKPLPGTKVSSQKIRSTVSTAGANMKKDGMKGQLRAKASGAKTTATMKPLGMTKMAKGGKVRGAGIAQRGTKFIGEV